jgi:hypothetical protein
MCVSLEKIERMARILFPAPLRCNTEKRKVRKQRDEFVQNAIKFLNKVYS